MSWSYSFGWPEDTNDFRRVFHVLFTFQGVSLPVSPGRCVYICMFTYRVSITLDTDRACYVSEKSTFDQVWSILDGSDPIWSKKKDHIYYQGQVDWLKRLRICKMWKKWKIWKKVLLIKNSKFRACAYWRTRAKNKCAAKPCLVNQEND